MMISVVIPLYNEEDNVQPLLDELLPVLDGMNLDYEVILVDDGSADATGARIAAAREAHPDRIRHLALRRNTGQTAALDAGFRAVRGDVVVMMDGDLQVDPRDIPRMVECLQGYDMVHGWRWQRRDTFFKRIQTRIANRIRNLLTGSDVHDTGCPLKVMRREVVERFRLFTGLHRFLITLARMEGFRTLEVKVAHRPRLMGTSKYGLLNRVFRAFRDLFAVRWMMARHYRPEVRELGAEGVSAEQGKGVESGGRAG